MGGIAETPRINWSIVVARPAHSAKAVFTAKGGAASEGADPTAHYFAQARTVKKYLCYAAAGREFDVAEELAGHGARPWAGRKIEFIRRGKKRRPEARETPYLPNYIFADMDDDCWHRVMKANIRYLAKTTYILGGMDLRAYEAFVTAVDGEWHEAQEIIRRNDTAAMQEFKAGDALKDSKGRFGENLLRYRGMVETAHMLYPLIEAETEMMGQTVVVRLDPLDVSAYE